MFLVINAYYISNKTVLLCVNKFHDKYNYSTLLLRKTTSFHYFIDKTKTTLILTKPVYIVFKRFATKYTRLHVSYSSRRSCVIPKKRIKSDNIPTGKKYHCSHKNLHKHTFKSVSKSASKTIHKPMDKSITKAIVTKKDPQSSVLSRKVLTLEKKHIAVNEKQIKSMRKQWFQDARKEVKNTFMEYSNKQSSDVQNALVSYKSTKLDIPKINSLTQNTPSFNPKRFTMEIQGTCYQGSDFADCLLTFIVSNLPSITNMHYDNTNNTPFNDLSQKRFDRMNDSTIETIISYLNYAGLVKYEKESLFELHLSKEQKAPFEKSFIKVKLNAAAFSIFDAITKKTDIGLSVFFTTEDKINLLNPKKYTTGSLIINELNNTCFLLPIQTHIPLIYTKTNGLMLLVGYYTSKPNDYMLSFTQPFGDKEKKPQFFQPTKPQIITKNHIESLPHQTMLAHNEYLKNSEVLVKIANIIERNVLPFSEKGVKIYAMEGISTQDLTAIYQAKYKLECAAALDYFKNTYIHAFKQFNPKKVNLLLIGIKNHHSAVFYKHYLTLANKYHEDHKHPKKYEIPE